MKKIIFTNVFLLLISITIFAQYDDATSHLKPDTSTTTKDPLDQVFTDDVIIQQSLAVGNDAVNGESFGFTTIKLKENNLRIGFEDTSNSASFPGNDWELTANDSDNGGLNHFSITDVTAGRRLFTVEAGAPNNSLYVESDGDIGINTNNPVVELHMVDGDSPTMRLEQDGSAGFGQQTWDVAGNETNFFIRDVTNGSKLPFKIKPGAPDNSLFVAANGNIGLGTQTPGHKLEVVGDAQVNDFFYFGDESTEGNWRVSVIASKLTFEKLEGGVWVSKVEMD